MSRVEDQARRYHPECTCGYWGNPIHAKQIRILAERLAVAESCINDAYEVAAKFRAEGAYAEAWGVASFINYHNKTPLFGFIGPCFPTNKQS